jgi:hypothetical protein
MFYCPLGSQCQKLTSFSSLYPYSTALEQSWHSDIHACAQFCEFQFVKYIAFSETIVVKQCEPHTSNLLDTLLAFSEIQQSLPIWTGEGLIPLPPDRELQQRNLLAPKSDLFGRDIIIIMRLHPARHEVSSPSTLGAWPLMIINGRGPKWEWFCPANLGKLVEQVATQKMLNAWTGNCICTHGHNFEEQPEIHCV